MIDPEHEFKRIVAVNLFMVFLAFMLGYMLGSASGGPFR